MKSLLAKLLVLLLTLPAALSAQANAMEYPFARRQKVPPLPQNLTWLNTAGPLELHDLRGKFVLLDFWTYCCINCMHILPELHKLEQAWPKNLVVIGVHSAKFTTEQDTQNIRAAIQRYKIEHPVINDARHELWESFGVNAWPTVILIDPEGYAVWGTSGEITFEQVDKVIRAGMPYYRQKKLLDETPLRFDMERQAAARHAAPLPRQDPGRRGLGPVVHFRQQSQPHRRRQARRHAAGGDRFRRRRAEATAISPRPSSTSRKAWPWAADAAFRGRHGKPRNPPRRPCRAAR